MNIGFERIDVHGDVVPRGKLMERIRAIFRGSFPSFLVPRLLNIDLAYIFSNAKGRWPPLFTLPEIVAHASQKRPRTMDFISIAVSRDLLYLLFGAKFLLHTIFRIEHCSSAFFI